MKKKDIDSALMEFVRMTIEDPSLLDNSENAKNIAQGILKKNDSESVKDKTNEKKRA